MARFIIITVFLALMMIIGACYSSSSDSLLDYGEALTKTFLYFEAQRSGRLPPNQRVVWRGDSALQDGADVGIDLVGGYYDAGDNVKFGFPMAYTITLLSWSVVEYGPQLDAMGELQHALEAIKWGTDYILKANPWRDVMFEGVGDGDSDHQCWQRPEDMTTRRKSYVVDESRPGSDLVGETAAALAAASIVFDKWWSSRYAGVLVDRAIELFEFAKKYNGKYSDCIPSAGGYYRSSSGDDEVLWAALWLHRATRRPRYLEFVVSPESGTGGGGTSRRMFSWDDKYVGVYILSSKYVLQGDIDGSDKFERYKQQAEEYLCNCIQKGDAVMMTPGGLLWFNEWNNLQYVTSASLAMVIYADYLKESDQCLQCPSAAEPVVQPDQLIDFAKSQVDYILGNNPMEMSYMVGFGSSYPQRVHHRASSIVSVYDDPNPVGCKDGFAKWFNRDEPNPNVLQGAIVGGPDKADNFEDRRSNYKQTEPAIANVAPLVGVLARIATR